MAPGSDEMTDKFQRSERDSGQNAKPFNIDGVNGVGPIPKEVTPKRISNGGDFFPKNDLNVEFREPLPASVSVPGSGDERQIRANLIEASEEVTHEVARPPMEEPLNFPVDPSAPDLN